MIYTANIVLILSVPLLIIDLFKSGDFNCAGQKLLILSLIYNVSIRSFIT